MMVIMISLHLIIHWDWIKMMARRIWSGFRSEGAHMSAGSRRNLILNIFIALSFTLSAVSGIYFLFLPQGGFEGGRNSLWDPQFLFSWTTWDLIHTWASVVMIAIAVLHFIIHWGWIKKVTLRFFRVSLKKPESDFVYEMNR